MKHNNKLTTLIGLIAVVAILVGVLVYPPPQEARAFDQGVAMSIDFNGGEPYNVYPNASFYNVDWVLLGSMQLEPNTEFDYYSNVYAAVPPTTVHIKISWDDSSNNWNPESPQIFAIDWLNPILLVANCW